VRNPTGGAERNDSGRVVAVIPHSDLGLKLRTPPETNGWKEERWYRQRKTNTNPRRKRFECQCLKKWVMEEFPSRELRTGEYHEIIDHFRVLIRQMSRTLKKTRKRKKKSPITRTSGGRTEGAQCKEREFRRSKKQNLPTTRAGR